MTHAFTKLHPAAAFGFFLAAIGTTMFCTHPLFLLLSLLGAGSFSAFLNKRKAIKRVAAMGAVFVVVAGMNLLLVHEGSTVLFTLWNRNYTLEALLYGLCMGAMFCAVLLWFDCYNCVMSDEKFLYLFAPLSPSVSLLLSMVLRLVPLFQRKTENIASARRCVGMSPTEGGKREKLAHSANILSALTSWALEGAVVTADSMRCRGYGTVKKRSNYACYTFSHRDLLWTLVSGMGLLAYIFFAIGGGAKAQFYPQLNLALTEKTILSAAAYAVFLLTPSAMELLEAITWRISRSKI